MLLLLPLLLSVCLCAPFSVSVRLFVNMHTEWIKKDLRLFRVAPFARLCPVTRAHAPQQLATRTHRKHCVPLFALRLCTIHIVCYNSQLSLNTITAGKCRLCMFHKAVD